MFKEALLKGGVFFWNLLISMYDCIYIIKNKKVKKSQIYKNTTMRKKIPLAWNIKPGMYAALNDKLEILVVEKTAEQAKSEAVIAGENPPFVVSTYDLQRPALLPKDVKSPSLILIGHNWRTGRLFLNKRSGSKSDTATLHGVYLDDLFVSPWTILNAKVFLSTVTVQIQPHTSISASSRDIYICV